MSTIYTNVSALQAQQGLANNTTDLNTTLQRLSTGLRINTGADDPAGLIASEGLQAEIAGINQAMSNTQMATNVIDTADGALGQISSLLLNIKGLVVESANSGAESQSQIEANQMQVDSAVQAITNIADTTNFNGLNLLNGNLDYVTSGVASNAIQNVQINSANFGTKATLPVQVNVITSAQTANLEFATSSITNNITLQVAGNNGTESLTFANGTTASAVAFAVNQISDSTGVTASLLNNANANSGIEFQSQGYGSQQYVSVTALSGNFATTDTGGNSATRVTGRDAVATVNGALTTGNGLQLTVNTDGLNGTISLSPTLGDGKTSFTITGGGAKFQLGSTVNSNEQVSIGIQSVAATALGNATLGYLSDMVTGGNASLTGGNAEQADQILNEAINQVAVLRGRIGAFEANTLNSDSSDLSVALTNVTSSESTITDANFAQETSELSRDEILQQAGTSVLATANSIPQSVLSLLQGH